MRCFQHQEAEAVGICGGCTKGLCRICAKEGPEGLRCGDACGEVIRSARDLLGKAHPNMGLARAGMKILILVLLGFGALFVAWGFLDGRDGPDLFLLITGGAFLLVGLLALSMARGLKSPGPGGKGDGSAS